MLLSGFSLAILSIIARVLIDSVSPYLVLALQQYASLLCFLPYALKHRIFLPKTPNNRLYLLRAVLGISSFQCAILSMYYMTLADVTAIGYISPLLTTILAILFLGERFSLPHAIALIGGLIGVLVVVRPSSDMVLAGVALILAAAIIKSIVGLMIKYMTSSDNAGTMMFYTVLYSSLWSTPLLVYFWKPLTHTEWMLILAAGFCTVFFHVGFIRACQLAPLVKLMPYDFMTLIFVTLLAYLFLNESVDAITLVGAAMILASSVVAMRYSGRNPTP